MKVMCDDNTGRTNLLQEDPDSEFTYIQVGRKKGYINKAYLIELCPDVLMSMI